MATVTAISRKDKDSGDERAVLRDAVAAAAEARDAVTRAENVIERAERLVAENQTKLANATKAVADAQSEDARRLASVLAAGGTSPTARATRQARTDEAEAADDVAAARSALASLREDHLVDAERVAVASRAVDAAVAAALKPTALVLLKEARACHLQFLRMCEALSVMSRSFNPWNDGGDLVKQIGRAGSPSEDDVRASVATRHEWQAAIEAMKTNADAKLPDLAGAE